MANEGWIKLFNARKWHYFTSKGKSLCGRWMVFTVPDDADQVIDHPDNCVECKRKLKKMKAKEIIDNVE